MNKTIKKIALLSFLSVTAINMGYGQAAKSDSLQYYASVASFYKIIGEQSPLYVGFEPIPYDPTVKGNVYLQDTLRFVNSQVNYGGIVYKNVPLVYDIYKGVLLSLLPNKVSQYNLVNEFVNYFNMDNHHYVRITGDTTNLKTGFYDELYNQKLRVLKKTEKIIQITSVEQHVEKYYSKNASFFLKKGNTYYSINSEGALISVLKDKKKELKQYIDTNNIKFKKDPAGSAKLLAAFYDSLTN
ncbi:hypothetical protein BDD43_4764 [Mucilaginibacter gracilis]|uniref:Uncharacterized protein n=1 Tax=Mucilaginibacter gracilis TaxID=423350 RepID=A0A495J7E1_9SPHI|nr:hypothetical protein [Mucilaginibacter gracilis]RKR84522.1 hypothetical protein BDD43_4764 [Mucilaginibacter gracilis]